MIMPELEISPNIFYTPDEVAALLRIPRRSVDRLLAAGLARGIKIGRNWRILGRNLLELPNEDEIAESDLTRSLLAASEPAFGRVWNNDEDSVYDGI